MKWEQRWVRIKVEPNWNVDAELFGGYSTQFARTNEIARSEKYVPLHPNTQRTRGGVEDSYFSFFTLFFVVVPPYFFVIFYLPWACSGWFKHRLVHSFVAWSALRLLELSRICRDQFRPVIADQSVKHALGRHVAHLCRSERHANSIAVKWHWMVSNWKRPTNCAKWSASRTDLSHSIGCTALLLSIAAETVSETFQITCCRIAEQTMSSDKRKCVEICNVAVIPLRPLSFISFWVEQTWSEIVVTLWGRFVLPIRPMRLLQALECDWKRGRTTCCGTKGGLNASWC